MFPVVAMQEELDGKFVHLGAFGKRKGLAHEPPQVLAQGVVEALDVVGGTFGIRGLVLSGGQDVVIAFQMIGAQQALTISRWDAGPKQLAVASSRGPKAQATIWRVRRQRASHSQTAPRRRQRTNVHISSSSKTSSG